MNTESNTSCLKLPDNWLDDRSILDLLEDAVENSGGVRALAANIAYSASRISQVRQAKVPVSDALAEALGYAKVTVYVPI